MLRNYLKVAFRNLRRNKSYAAINVGGLAVGLAACLLIGLYLRSELSYDAFHEQSDRIHRVMETATAGDQTRKSLTLPDPLAPALTSEQPAVERAVRLHTLGEVRLQQGGNAFYEPDFLAADSTFFAVFDGFELVRGNAQSALDAPYDLVISEAMAEKYFGDGENPVGQTLTLSGDETMTGGTQDYTVTGVARVPSNSHLQFNFLTSYATIQTAVPDDYRRELKRWDHYFYYTYVLLEEGVSPNAVEADVKALFARNRTVEDVKGDSYTLQPIESIHLRSNTEDELRPGGDPRYLYILGAVALLILGVACVNYTNLATARAAQRTREVGVRKTVGATRGALARQFLGEALIFSLLALVLAVGLARGTLPFFNELLAQPLAFSYAEDAGMLAVLAAAGVMVGLLSGSYPALFLSRFRPTEVLRGGFRLGRRGAFLRGGLLVFQFGVAVALVAGTLVIGQQLDHVRTHRLGLDAERVVTIHARDALDSDDGSGYDAFKEELLQQAGVQHVSAVGRELPFPVERDMAMSLSPEGVQSEARGDRMPVNMLSIAPSFTETMGIPVVRGRDLTLEVYRESEEGTMPVLINEAAVEAYGWEGEALDKTFEGFRPTPRVVGVVENFHYQSLKAQIEPLVMRLSGTSDHVVARVQSGNLPQTLDQIEAAWASVTNAPFDYGFLDRRFDQLYRADQRLATLIGGFSLLAVLVACLGLFGLAAYAAERRRKEIGIRKAMGASARHVVALLSKDFLTYVAIGFAVAVPVAWYGMRQWLEGFAYRIEIGVGVFALAGALVLVVALATVGTQALRAARANPAEALRDE